MAAQPLFGLLPAGQPLLTAPTSQPSPTSFLFLIPHSSPTNTKQFSHLAVFLLPGIALPDGTAAAIYIAQNPSAFAPGGAGAAGAGFKFLGGVGPGKESAVFKLGGSGGNTTNTNAEGGVVIGIEIEDGVSVAERMTQSQTQAQAQSTALVRTNTGVGQTQTQILAQRIIQNAFNFLSSFSGQVNGSGVEVVPLKAFQEWWKKFEAKVKNDPGFLERQQD
ncbi:hypothetical protein F4808DRAFT_436941 [Astrocystis sublimbata]|nr:hypothetical protein F4808DRAFT_436941 [Astrocystis sublimbata]